MIVYVCYSDHGWDGCAPPEAVYFKESNAELWCTKNQKSWSCARYEYRELEMDDYKEDENIEGGSTGA